MNKIIKKVGKDLHCYVGQTLKDEPHGKGELEIYWPGPEIHKKVLKQIDTKWEKNNQKDFLHKTKGYLLIEKHIGIWRNNKLEGLCEKIEYYEPAFFINKDGTPAISQREIGYFKNNKKEGVFKSFLNNPDDNTDIDYTVSYYEYKNDWLVKDKNGKFPKEIKEKEIPEEIKKISR